MSTDDSRDLKKIERLKQCCRDDLSRMNEEYQFSKYGAKLFGTTVDLEKVANGSFEAAVASVRGLRGKLHDPFKAWWKSSDAQEVHTRLAMYRKLACRHYKRHISDGSAQEQRTFGVFWLDFAKALDAECVRGEDKAFGVAVGINPLRRVSTYTPESTPQIGVLDYSTVVDYDTGWHLNATKNAEFYAMINIAQYVAAERLALPKIASLLVGTAVTSSMAYENLQVEERVQYKSIESHAWYGRVQVNLLTRKPEAVEYHGRGPSVRNLVTPVRYSQRVADSKSGTWWGPLVINIPVPGTPLDGPHADDFPERSFGTIELSEE